jgi:hypothetical protein
VRDRRSTAIWMRSCGTVAKADGNGENKLRPVVTEGSYLLEHLIKSNGYETLKRVQGDKITITTQPPRGEENITFDNTDFQILSKVL